QAPPGPASATSPGTDQAALDQPVIDQPEEAIPPATAPTPAAGPAHLDGYGRLRFGMTEDEARAAMDGGLKETPGVDPGNACHYLGPGWDGAPGHLAFMFDGGRFVRYDVANDEDVAPGGGRRGMTADEIRRLYPGRVEASPHKYTD